LIELAELTRRLGQVVDPEVIPVWLSRPLIRLDDDKPIDVIARGDYKRVSRLIAELESPGVS
jgi:uncharacterized protein (DUF2384 family)